ncbi:MAG: GspE/PulE family protein [Dokdonella sp.]
MNETGQHVDRSAGPARPLDRDVSERAALDKGQVLAELIACTGIDIEMIDGGHSSARILGMGSAVNGVASFETDEPRGLVDASLVRALWLPPLPRMPNDLEAIESLVRFDYSDGKTVVARSVRTRASRLGIMAHEVRAREIVRRFVPWASLANVDIARHAPVDQASGRPSPAPRAASAAATAGETSGNAWQLKAQRLGLATLSEEQLICEQSALDQVPAEIARDNHILPLRMQDGRLHVAVSDPTNRESLAMLNFLCKQAPVIEVASVAAIDRAIARAYSTLDDDPTLLEEGPLAEVDTNANTPALEHMAHEAPIVRLVNNILTEAMRRGASDIHLRPGAQFVDLVFRIDGDLVLIRRFTKTLLPAVVGRIKVMGRMDITQRHIPQDGQARVRDGHRAVDLRISVIPTVEGESVVVRLLNPTFELKDINDLGFSEDDCKRFGDLLQRTSGMVLVTGPTGSGKSTTLYAALKTIISGNVNVITVENPVEYRIAGIEQVPVSTERGLTFAKALRNILRHDPDVIMIGEIRDGETAHIAVESGLTGHLVLSTLHTNSAAGTMSRLLEMGVEDYLIRATLLAVVAQRLVRKTCVACKVLDELGGELRTVFHTSPDEPFYHGAGCRECRGRGYRGRRMTYELLVATPELRRLIQRSADAEILERQAVADGMLPLTQHALSLARAGEISLSEAFFTRTE